MASLCSRCNNVPILEPLKSTSPPITCWFEPTNGAGRQDPAEIRETIAGCHSFGTIQTISYDSECALCRILRQGIADLSPQPHDEILLAPAWTIERLEPSIGTWWRTTKSFKEGQLLHWDVKFAKLLYVAKKRPDFEECLFEKWPYCPADKLGSLTYAHLSRTALALCDSDSSAVMCGREIRPEIDFGLLRRWIKNCLDNHGNTCSGGVSSSLSDIRLIDIESRTIVPYVDVAEYLCLSYVWGRVKQVEASLGPLPSRLPNVIEDTISAVRALGKRYLWVDSLCIEQHNSAQKNQQIGLMATIYRNALATIVALDGTSANSRLGRINAHQPGHSQVSIHIGKENLVTLLPTLAQQIERSTWKQRAWTYQEQQLSARILYFTQGQVYFECNSIQCCESIRENFEAVHTWSNQHRLAARQWRSSQTMSSRGVFSIKEDNRGGDIRYDECIREYTSRKLSFESDGMNAVLGLLEQLQETSPVIFQLGFHWGLPVNDMAFALLWYSTATTCKRRQDFPSWSWVGWSEPLQRVALYNKWRDRPASPQATFRPPERATSYFLEIFSAPHLPLYQSNPDLDVALRQLDWTNQDRIQNSQRREWPTLSPSQMSRLQEERVRRGRGAPSKVLFIETIVFRPKFSDVACTTDPKVPEEELGFALTIAGVECTLICYTSGVAARIKSQEVQYLAIIHRRFENYWWYYELLVLDWKHDFAYRVGVAKLAFKTCEQRVDVLRALNPARARFALA